MRRADEQLGLVQRARVTAPSGSRSTWRPPESSTPRSTSTTRCARNSKSVGCEQTESHGKASLTFKASKNGLYLIRVAALASSQLAELLARSVPADARGGAAGRAAAIRRGQRAGRSHPEHQRGLLVHDARGRQLPDQPRQRDRRRVRQRRAVRARAPSSFGEKKKKARLRLLHINCGGYGLFTPGPGQGGRYSFEMTPRASFRGIQRFHLQVAPAGPAETAPGMALGNYARAHGHLRRQRRARAAPVSHGSHEPLQPDAEADRARLGRIQPPAAQPKRRGDRMRLRRQRLADAASTSCSPGTLLRGRLRAQRHRRQLHARARVAHDHLDLALVLLLEGRARAKGWGST